MKSTTAKGLLILAGSSFFLISLYALSSKSSKIVVKSNPEFEYGDDNDDEEEDRFYSFYDLSRWKEENVKDLFDISMSVVKDRDWPKPPVEVKKGRRRLTDATDRWKVEEEEMRKEFMQLKKDITAPTPKKSNTIDIDTDPNGTNQIDHSKRTHTNTHARKLQTLPPISKTCTKPDDAVVPCPPPNLAQLCDKYNGGDFESCFQTCKPSVCCTHDSKRRSSPSCDTAVNCEHWIPCYIVWWKLSDTIGPATFLRMVQEDDFFNKDIQSIRDEYNDPQFTEFYEQWFNRFIDDDATDLDDRQFLNEELWVQYHNS